MGSENSESQKPGVDNKDAGMKMRNKNKIKREKQKEKKKLRLLKFKEGDIENKDSQTDPVKKKYYKDSKHNNKSKTQIARFKKKFKASGGQVQKNTKGKRHLLLVLDLHLTKLKRLLNTLHV